MVLSYFKIYNGMFEGYPLVYYFNSIYTVFGVYGDGTYRTVEMLELFTSSTTETSLNSTSSNEYNAYYCTSYCDVVGNNYICGCRLFMSTVPLVIVIIRVYTHYYLYCNNCISGIFIPGISRIPV